MNVFNDLLGKYVIVRCRDAGVHAGVLVSAKNRTCFLRDSRRLHYWKSAKGTYLSGVSQYGITDESNIGAPCDLALTETCEIIATTEVAEASIRAAKNAHE